MIESFDLIVQALDISVAVHDGTLALDDCLVPFVNGHLELLDLLLKRSDVVLKSANLVCVAIDDLLEVGLRVCLLLCSGFLNSVL